MQDRYSLPYILFDLGNVIVDLDIPATLQAISELTSENWNDVHQFLREQKWMERYETGKLSDQEFIDGFLAFSPPDTPPHKIVEAWNAMLVDIPISRLEWLDSLRSSYRIGLLSNTNNLHIQWVHGYLQKHHAIHDFEHRYFDEVYYSHQIGLRKPDVACFEFAIKAIGLPAHQVLFIDDLPENTAAARQAGLMTGTHDQGREISEWLDHYIAHPEI